MGLNAWVAVIFAKQTCIKKFKSQRTTLNANRIDIRDTKCTRNRVHLRI